MAFCIDEEGNSYFAGSTQDERFKTTENAYIKDYSIGGGSYVIKVNNTGTRIIYSTFIGAYSHVSDICTDKFGNAFLTGVTSSKNFPVTNDKFKKPINFRQNVIIVKLNPEGSKAVYSTCIAGSNKGLNNNLGIAIAVDDSGYAYVGGIAGSFDFTTTSSPINTFMTDNESTRNRTFILKLDTDGDSLISSVCFGKVFTTIELNDLKLDKDGRIYFVCFTYDPLGYIVTPHAFQK